MVQGVGLACCRERESGRYSLCSPAVGRALVLLWGRRLLSSLLLQQLVEQRRLIRPLRSSGRLRAGHAGEHGGRCTRRPS